MKIIIESTTKLVTLEDEDDGSVVLARLWEGETDSGVRVHCFVTRIAHLLDETPERVAQFKRELLDVRPPSPAVARAYDLRLIL